MNYQRFDRHSAFTPEMMTLTRNAIANSNNNRLTNMLYGLYDGYLYNDLLELAISSEVDADTIEGIKGLVKSIEMYIKLHTETV